ncbi:phosphotransferase family enzyme [Kribbella amoyensis]|uniref:Phosphotransferase family enzyme n=1 Tax=Kribbella amoyensis TaxID=996641 RepID=A0A561BXR8_9ACTN|nr:phosphotransferase [Kribbella amoyensis]TWD83684.1 phosphotransferase family enzyme [Kribbella amoyensis]
MRPDWEPLTSGTGQHNGGVWRTPDGLVVKRLLPGPEQPRHHAYWQRQALVAESGLVARTPGLRSPTTVKVERDGSGITVWTSWVEPVALTSAELAHALGRFAASVVAEPAWGARDVLRTRLATVERRGGWRALDRIELPAELRHAVEALWSRRAEALAELDALPRVPTHGDAHPVNLLGRDGDDVIAIDWEQFGVGPIGFDLGYLLLAEDRTLDDLLGAYGNRRGARRGAVITAAYTAVSRAAWSLDQPEPGDHVRRLTALADVVDEAARAKMG